MEVSGLGPEFVLGIAAFLLAFHLGMRYVITYRLTDSRLEVLLFGFLPVSMTRYDLHHGDQHQRLLEGILLA